MGTKIRDLPDIATSIDDNDFLVLASSDNKTKKKLVERILKVLYLHHRVFLLRPPASMQYAWWEVTSMLGAETRSVR